MADTKRQPPPSHGGPPPGPHPSSEPGSPSRGGNSSGYPMQRGNEGGGYPPAPYHGYPPPSMHPHYMGGPPPPSGGSAPTSQGRGGEGSGKNGPSDSRGSNQGAYAPPEGAPQSVGEGQESDDGTSRQQGPPNQPPHGSYHHGGHPYPPGPHGQHHPQHPHPPPHYGPPHMHGYGGYPPPPQGHYGYYPPHHGGGYGMPPGGPHGGGYPGPYPMQQAQQSAPHPGSGAPSYNKPAGGRGGKDEVAAGNGKDPASDGRDPAPGDEDAADEDKDKKIKTEQNVGGLEDEGEEEEEVISTKVDPMRHDFYFYAMDHQEEHRKLALEQVEKLSLKEEGDGEEKKEADPFLVLTNLNERLMAAWEQEPTSVLASYLSKEEEDRQRFMNDEEIASRHCATLTARAKSPKSPSTSGVAASLMAKSPSSKIPGRTKSMTTDEKDVKKEQNDEGLNSSSRLKEEELEKEKDGSTDAAEEKSDTVKKESQEDKSKVKEEGKNEAGTSSNKKDRSDVDDDTHKYESPAKKARTEIPPTSKNE